MAQDQRKRRQQERLQAQEAGAVRQLAKHRKRLIEILIGASLLDVVRETIRAKTVDWLLTHLGRLGRVLVGNPFFLLTLALTGIGVWLLWVVVKARIAIDESLLVGASGERLQRAKVSEGFAGWIFAITIVCLALVAYGAYVYATVPVPNVVALHDAWYATNLHNADVYVNINLQNYSSGQVTIHPEGTMYASGKAIPANTDDMGHSYTVVAGGQHGIHFPIEISRDDNLRRAFVNDEITVVVTANYNDGKRDVTYTYEGRVIAESQGNCFANADGKVTCKGVVDALRTEWN